LLPRCRAPCCCWLSRCCVLLHQSSLSLAATLRQSRLQLSESLLCQACDGKGSNDSSKQQ
jgi:hypothetical protein